MAVDDLDQPITYAEIRRKFVALEAQMAAMGFAMPEWPQPTAEETASRRQCIEDIRKELLR